MELYQLRTFVKVAELLNITRSAEQLNSSQPAVSAHIKSLEDELDIVLFNRKSRGMKLTYNGEKLKNSALHILDSVDSMIHLADELTKKKQIKIKIATNTFSDVLKLNELMSKTSGKKPSVTFAFSRDKSGAILISIQKEVYDCGFIFGRNKYHDLKSLFLKRIPLQIIAPFTWENKILTMNFEELISLPWILGRESCPYTDEINKTLRKYKKQLNIVATVDDEDQILNLVESEIGISIIPKSELFGSVKNRKICVYPHLEMNIDLSFVYLNNRENDPGIIFVKELLTEIWDLDKNNFNKE